LLESWRNDEPDIDTQAVYESKLHGWLLQEKKFQNLKELKTQDVDNLTVSIMTKKFNESFTNELLPEQASLLQDYVFSIGKEGNISSVFQNRKSACLQELKEYALTCDSDIVKSKISLVTEKIENLPTKNIDDGVVSRYLTIMKLSSELRG
jgi:hypothetical protein